MTAPDKGGEPLSVTVTTKLSEPENPLLGIYVIKPEESTFTVPLMAAVVT